MDIKTCTKCDKPKDVDEFNKKSRNKDGLNSACKTCTRVDGKKSYDKRPDFYCRNNKQRREAIRDENRKSYVEHMKEKQCVDCGEGNIIVLQFDHIDRNNKSGTVTSHMDSSSWKRVLHEMEKCEIRCANCHAIRTAYQFGFWKTKL